jgi:hypothetical protein
LLKSSIGAQQAELARHPQTGPQSQIFSLATKALMHTHAFSPPLHKKAIHYYPIEHIPYSGSKINQKLSRIFKKTGKFLVLRPVRRRTPLNSLNSHILALAADCEPVCSLHLGLSSGPVKLA